MTAEELIELYTLLTKEGIVVWIDGGWCVDALLGKQTREHPDVDIAVERADNTKLRKFLEDKGFTEEARNDSAEWMYAMKNAVGHQVDVHAFAYDESGNNIYGVSYPYGSLTGKGTIAGQEVNCISPEWIFKFKTSYEPKEKDKHDAQALSNKFGFVLPASHR